MAESGLSVDYSTIQQTVRDFLGGESQDVDRFIQAGYRLALHPPPLGKGHRPHRWSFLSPTATLTLWPATTTGVVTVSGTGNLILTVAVDTFYPSMVNATITSDTLGNAYTITAYTTAKIVTVHANASGDTGDTFTITPGLYALPDDYAYPMSNLWYAAGLGVPDVRLVDEGAVRDHIAKITSTGDPGIFAVVPREKTGGYDPTAGTSGNQTRWDLLVWPTPSAVRAVKYKYGRLIPSALDATTVKYPVGGMMFGLLVEQAAVAIAEQRQRGAKRDQWNAFMDMLATSVLNDGHTPVNLGYCGDDSDGRSAWPHPNVSHPVTHHAAE